MNESNMLIAKLMKFQEKISFGDLSDLEIIEANQIAEELLEITRKSYDSISKHYTTLRGEEPHEQDISDWEKILSIARVKVKMGLLGDHLGCIKILDVGTGSGRDIKYASKFKDVQIIGIDNSDGFIELLKELENEKEIPPKSFLKADMRNLSSFSDNYFDIVRNNASLIHLPVIKKGYMADLAISESYRVLKRGGLIYLLVREGNGLKFIDTNEGLGRRFYQLFTRKSLTELVSRNGFKNIKIWKRPSSRNKKVTWLALIAEKLCE